MNFKLSEREELLRKSMREFAEKEIPPRMEAMEETGEFPVDLLRKMGDVGILGVIAPPEYGGTGMGNLARIIILEEMGRVCPAIPMALQVHHMATHALSKFGNEEQKKKYMYNMYGGKWTGTMCLTEPGAGTDVGALKTSAKRLPDGTFSITGTKI
ncbi:MAG: acyl-CoA dehydrogenase family protein, partial [candidate division NC10 bacterium]